MCLYWGPEGTRPSHINGLLVDTRLAVLLNTAELLPRRAIMGHTLVRFDLHLKGASQRVVNFVRPKPIELAPQEEHERLLLVDCLLDPTEDGWRAALSTADVDQAWAFWTPAAQATLLALFCPDIAPNTLPAGAAMPHTTPTSPAHDGDEAALLRTSPGLPSCAGLARVNGRPPLQLQQSLPLQHHTMVYNMRSNQQQPCEHPGHGQATSEPT